MRCIRNEDIMIAEKGGGESKMSIPNPEVAGFEELTEGVHLAPSGEVLTFGWGTDESAIYVLNQQLRSNSSQTPESYIREREEGFMQFGLSDATTKAGFRVNIDENTVLLATPVNHEITPTQIEIIRTEDGVAYSTKFGKQHRYAHRIGSFRPIEVGQASNPAETPLLHYTVDGLDLVYSLGTIAGNRREFKSGDPLIEPNFSDYPGEFVDQMSDLVLEKSIKQSLAVFEESMSEIDPSDLTAAEEAFANLRSRWESREVLPVCVRASGDRGGTYSLLIWSLTEDGFKNMQNLAPQYDKPYGWTVTEPGKPLRSHGVFPVFPEGCSEVEVFMGRGDLSASETLQQARSHLLGQQIEDLV